MKPPAPSTKLAIKSHAAVFALNAIDNVLLRNESGHIVVSVPPDVFNFIEAGHQYFVSITITSVEITPDDELVVPKPKLILPGRS